MTDQCIIICILWGILKLDIFVVVVMLKSQYNVLLDLNEKRSYANKPNL